MPGRGGWRATGRRFPSVGRRAGGWRIRPAFAETGGVRAVRRRAERRHPAAGGPRPAGEGDARETGGIRLPWKGGCRLRIRASHTRKGDKRPRSFGRRNPRRRPHPRAERNGRTGGRPYR
ncbi:MAG: hypothetical protein A9Z00_08825 [Thermobacillus sp. ZCTH02-B1]|nr:MAG: hypothetical protein A9Z00_08825 [Thermobacillus sp. ZCTH02-B1]